MSDGTTSTPDGGTPDGEATTGTPPAETGSGDDLEQVKADAERWKALARKHEDRAKAIPTTRATRFPTSGKARAAAILPGSAPTRSCKRSKTQ
jgi:hypothetical protein